RRQLQRSHPPPAARECRTMHRIKRQKGVDRGLEPGLFPGNIPHTAVSILSGLKERNARLAIIGPSGKHNAKKSEARSQKSECRRCRLLGRAPPYIASIGGTARKL